MKKLLCSIESNIPSITVTGEGKEDNGQNLDHQWVATYVR